MTKLFSYVAGSNMYSYSNNSSDIDEKIIYIDESNYGLRNLSQIPDSSKGIVNSKYINIKNFLDLCSKSVPEFIEVLLYYKNTASIQTMTINKDFNSIIAELFNKKHPHFNYLRMYNAYLGCVHNLLTKRAKHYYEKNILYKYMIILTRNYVLAKSLLDLNKDIILSFPDLVHYAIKQHYLPNNFQLLVDNLNTRDISKIPFDEMLKVIKQGASTLNFLTENINSYDTGILEYYTNIYKQILAHYLVNNE